MTLNEAYEIYNNNMLNEATKDELITYFNRIQNGDMSEETALNRIKQGLNYTELKNKEEKPLFKLEGFGANKKNWITEFANSFPVNQQAAATNFFKKVLVQASNTISNINQTRREDVIKSRENSKNRIAERLSKIKRSAEFHGYGN